MKLIVYCDWGSRWNPWNAWLWVFITDSNWKELEKRYKNLWIKTNNEAEYMWAFFWIKRAIELWATDIDLYMDSSLVINQLSWSWKTKKEELWKIRDSIWDLIKKNNIKITYTWIGREKNKEADRLSNIAMDNKQKI